MGVSRTQVVKFIRKGDSGVNYSVQLNPASVAISADGVVTPGTDVIATAYKSVGTTTNIATDGYFKLAYTTANGTSSEVSASGISSAAILNYSSVVFKYYVGSSVAAYAALAINRQGDKGDKGDKGNQGDQGPAGSDAVVWGITASTSVLTARKGYTFTEDIVVTGYQIKGESKRDFNFYMLADDDPNVSAEYSVDGGTWANCEILNKGSMVAFAYGVGLYAATLSSLKPKQYIKFRMKCDGTVVAITPKITIASDGTCVLRGPQLWADCADGYEFSAGGIGDAYKDVVLYNDNYYSCINNHTKTAGNYPGSADDVNNGYWQLGDKVELVAAKILLATYALVKNMGVEVLDMKDANGNILFQAKDGEVTCKTGTFENVNVYGDLTVSKLCYKSNTQYDGKLNCSFIYGAGDYTLPHLADGEYMRVVVFNPQLSRAYTPTVLTCEGANDKLLAQSASIETGTVSSVELVGWHELIGCNLYSGNTIWIYQTIRQN